MNKIRIGSRSSPLAIVQVDEISGLFKEKNMDFSVTHQTYDSAGDIDKLISLTANVADNFFTDTLDQALLQGEIDIAVHSAKDLPQHIPNGLEIFALTKSADNTDAYVGRDYLENLPAGSRIGTSSPVRQEGVRAINDQLVPVDIRGTIDERIQLIEQGQVDGIIVATIALKRLGLQGKIKNIMPWEGMALQGQLAIVGRVSDQKLKEQFKPLDVRLGYGKVTLLGAGPGDPELITLKGVHVLNKADCVLYDFLVHKRLLDHAPQAERIYVGKRKTAHSMSQKELGTLIRQKAMEGKQVVRLKGGDPLIFGRGADEIEYLNSYHIDVDVIAGLCSATAIPTQMGIPLTARGYSSSVAFVSAHTQDDSQDPHAAIEIPETDTLVFFMGLTKLQQIVDALIRAGRKPSTPVAVISKGTRIDETVIIGKIDNIRHKVQEAQLQAPALIIVGLTVSLYKQKHIPQEIILYTGTNPEKYRSLGQIVHLPMIEIKAALMTEGEFNGLLDRFKEYNVVLLTSRFAVKYFLDKIRENEIIWDQLKEKDIIVIGKDTATALMDYHLYPRHIAQEETGRGIIAVFKKYYDMPGLRILFPRSNLPNPYIKDELISAGAHVHEIAIYQNVKPEKEALPDGPIDKILFTSPSTVRNFLTNYHQIPDEWKIISKGEVTQKALIDNGYKSEILIYG